MNKPSAKERWTAALQQRRKARRALVDSVLLRKSQVAPPMADPVIEPLTDMLVTRGRTPVGLSHKKASVTTARSWATRKQKFGRAGRLSKDTFFGNK